MNNEQTDFEIISLGSNCPVKFTIRHFHPNQAAYPFDWILTNNLDEIIKVINNKKYDHFINFNDYEIELNYKGNYADNIEKNIIENIDHELIKKLIVDFNKSNLSLSEFGFSKKITDIVNDVANKMNKKINVEEISQKIYTKTVAILSNNGTKLVHDHHLNVSWKEVEEKYHRRFSRFFNALKSNKKLIFVRYIGINENFGSLFDCLNNNIENFVLLYLFHNPNLDDQIKEFQKINDKFYTYTGNLIFDKEPYYKNIFISFLEKIKYIS